MPDNSGTSLQVAMEQLEVEDDVRHCINALADIGLDRSVAWAMLVRWLIEQVANEVEVSPQAAAALESLVGQATQAQWQAAMHILEGVAIEDRSSGKSGGMEDEIPF